MAQLKDSLITGDLRVTGTIYGDVPLNDLVDADDLKAIEALSGTSGLLKKTAANTWTLDTTAYKTGTVTSVRVQATSPVVSSVNTAQTSTLNTTISLADGYGDTKNPYASKTARYVLAAPASAAGAPTFRALTNADVGLGNVENTKLSTWTGSTAITTLGTITTGTIPWANISGKPSQAAAWPNWGQIQQSGAENIREGTGDLTDNTEILTSYVSNNGFADTNAKGVVYRRDAIKLYNYIKGKTDTLYATAGHNHDSTYVNVTGDTMSGSLIISKAGECGLEVNNTQTTNPNQVAFIVGASGNGGIYSRKHSKWIVFSDASGNVVLNGNANSATGFASAKSIALTGNVTGSATGGNGSNGWSIATTIGSGVVTNAMLAGSIANGKLVNSKVTIAGNDVSLGGSLAAATLKTSLGLNSAMHYIGKATVAITDGSTTDPKIGGNATTLVSGDVVIDSSDSREYVWNGSKWELLGGDSSYKVTQTAVTDAAYSGSDTATTFVSAVTQNANGEITVTKRKLPTYNNYSHPTGDGNKHVPANGTSNNGKFLQATATAGTYQWASLPTASTTGAGIIQIGTGASNAAAGNHTHNYAGSSSAGGPAIFTGNGSHTAAVTANEFNMPVGTVTIVGNVSNTSMSHNNNANAEMIIKTHPTSGTAYYEARLGFSSNGSLYYMPVNTSSWKTIAYTDSNITGNAANVTGTVAIGHGGTGATTAANARTNLGLGTLAIKSTIGNHSYTPAGTIAVNTAGSTVAADDITAWTTNTPTAVTKKTVVVSATVSNEVLTISTGDSVSVTAGTAASLSYTARTVKSGDASYKFTGTAATLSHTVS